MEEEGEERERPHLWFNQSCSLEPLISLVCFLFQGLIHFLVFASGLRNRQYDIVPSSQKLLIYFYFYLNGNP